MWTNQGDFIRGRLIDGTDIEIRWCDKGVYYPAQDRNGKQVDSYTTIFTINNKELVSQVSVRYVDTHGNAARVGFDRNTLRAAGIDIGSLHLVSIDGDVLPLGWS